MMKKRMFLLIGVLVLVLLGSGIVSAVCDYTCNGKCSTKTGKTVWDIIPCSTAEDPDCPNPALAKCCGNNVCDAEENFLTCPEDCEDVRRNIGSQAYDAVAECSTFFVSKHEYHPCEHANDGNPFSYWAMWRVDAEKWLRITLDKKSWIDHIYITSRLEYDTPVSKWNIEFSDGSIIESSKTFNLANPIDLTFEPKFVDYVQFNLIEHGLTPGVTEFEIYEIEDLDMYEEACTDNYGDHAWLPDYCCGDDAEDLGSIVGDSLCYYYELSNEWWWLDAGTWDFEIYTIEDVDYASNSEEWFRCGIDMDEGEIMKSSMQDPNPALKFLCYKQRDDYYFAECCVKEGTNVLGVVCYNDDTYPEKVRYIGEPTVLLEREETLNFKSSPVDAGYENIPLNPGNWKDYDNLEFFFRLDNAKDYEVLLLEGPEEFTYSLEDYEIRLRQPLAAVSSYGEWKHAVIPIREMASYATANISQIVFYTNITKFEFDETANIFVERIFLNNKDTQYCTNAEVSWTNDLDERYVPEPQSYEACDSFPAYKWTGNYCCGDDYFSEDDFYKDDIAGCWHSSVVVNNSITSDRDVLFYNGDFYGCNSEFSSLIDYDADICEALGDYFCDADGWSDEASGNVPASLRGRESSVPDDVSVSQPTSCCSVDTCWNGTGCADGLEGRPDDFYNLSGHIYRCVYGEWQTADLKYSWDNMEYGFCPYADQCLVSRTRDPMCVDDAGYVEDHYCDDGEWTTRTRMIALALLDTKAISTDFTLYCDYYTNALADYAYGAPSIEKYLMGDETRGYADKSCFTDKDADCVNNFCILNYADTGGVKTSFGVSLNKDIDDVDYSFLDAIGKERDYCDDLHGNGPFFRCDARDVWYNPDSNMIIYAKNKIEISEQQTVFGQIAEFFTNIFEIIIGWVPTVPAGSAVDLSLIEEVHDYNTLYLQKQGDKEVTALMEDTADGVLITVVYDNFDFPICDAVERLTRHEPYQKTKCNLTDDGYVIYSNAPEIWQGLTSKLRIE